MEAERKPESQESKGTVLDMFLAMVRENGGKVALKSKLEGRWRSRTWNEVAEEARAVTLGLISLGVQKGDRITILSQTREEWFIGDLGILGAGAITVPIYQSNLPHECAYILKDSEVKVVFAEDPNQLAKLKEVKAEIPTVEKVVLFSGQGDGDWVMTYRDLCDAGRKYGQEHGGVYDERLGGLAADDVATHVYTSGTTGPPKGVVLTHSNFVFECNASKSILPISPDDETLLFLPLAHIFAKIVSMTALNTGFVTSFAESIDKVVDNLGEVRPTFVASVPRIYEKVYTKVTSDVEAAGGLKKTIFDWSVGVGREVSAIRQRGGQVPWWLGRKFKLADKLVFSKLKEKFGGRLKFFVSGGAPLGKEIAEFFHAADILILEGYGLTENTAATNINRPDNYKFGTVGLPLPGVEIRIADDGEVLIRGENVMREYYKMPEATREALDNEGWLHSGDVGELDADGFLKITDRKKDLIVTAGGKNIAPQNIESRLKTNQYVSQVMMVGDRRPYCVALITLDEENITRWAKEQGVTYQGTADLARNTWVRELIQGVVDDLNGQLASFETIKKFAIMEQDFSQETGEMTPTLKVKRKFTSEKYRDVIEGLYQEA